MVETEKQEGKKQSKEEFEVVAELPQQAVRGVVDDSGKKIILYTKEEALKEILSICRKLDKAF